MSAPIVMKFGGTSLADMARISHAARHIAARADQGAAIAVVVSAMGADTDRLAQLSDQAISGGAPAPDSEYHDSEYDVILAAGEQVSAGLLALSLQRLGYAARSFLGWQVPIRTQGRYGRARIIDIETAALKAHLDRGQIAIVAGFQGVSAEGRIMTLGRGGSDVSAVALAAALKARACEIWTDVEGVFTADPQIVERAHRLDRLSYEEMVELASLGARVLQTRAVELAAAHNVPLSVLPAHADIGDVDGTKICAEEEMIEQRNISGIAYSRDEAKITLGDLADRPGIAAGVFSPLAAAGITVDMIIQSAAHESGRTDITFTLAEGDLEHALKLLKDAQGEIGYQTIDGHVNVAKVSVVGIGMRSQVGIAEVMFRALAEAHINIQAISTSEIKISVLIAGEEMEQAVRILHSAYGLDG